MISLSDPTERARVTAGGGYPSELDPGERSIDAHLHTRSLRLEQAVEQLCIALDSPELGRYDLLALAHHRRVAGTPLVLAIDGLDEAGLLDAPRLAQELLLPLAVEALVVVTARPEIAGVDTEQLLTLPGQAVVPIDLGPQPESTLADVRRYVELRLREVAPTMAPDKVAQEIEQIAQSGDDPDAGLFLLARLITSQLRADPIDTTVAGWPDKLARGVGAALERDLDRTVISSDGRPQPTAARELLTALACSYGGGFRADDVLWPAVASALSPTGHHYRPGMPTSGNAPGGISPTPVSRGWRCCATSSAETARHSCRTWPWRWTGPGTVRWPQARSTRPSAIFGVFSAFWLSFGFLLIGLTSGWWGVDGDASGQVRATHLLSFLLVFVLLTVSTLRLPLTFTLGFVLVDITFALAFFGVSTASAGLFPIR